MRNPDFTGRDRLLERFHEMLQRRSKIAVLPQALHGQGGVGKTQLAAEYVYRYGAGYSIIWWISAEQPVQIRSSLANLADRLDLEASEDIQQTVDTLLGTLAETPMRWLLVYDNAGLPDDVVPLLPTSGGHVIVTSRNPAWGAARLGDSIEVDVFERQESIELLRKTTRISTEDAERLAEQLGDLPLALEQAAKWCEASGMDPHEYSMLLTEHAAELLTEGKPASYPRSLYTSVTLALEGLRQDSPAAAELVELFSYLGTEPLSMKLLERGTLADTTTDLGRAKRNPIDLRKAYRDLRELGLARVDTENKIIQAHRLVQLVIRDSLSGEKRARRQHDVQHLLASATPPNRVETQDWPTFAMIVPHVRAADLVNAEDVGLRRSVIQHMRYLYAVGDYEADRELGDLAVATWARPVEQGGLGPDHELTLMAAWRLASAQLALGDAAEAATLITATTDRMRATLGDDHETTMLATRTKALIERALGNYDAALTLDRDTLERFQRLNGDTDSYTLTAQNNVAVNLRLLGDFAGALEIDSYLVSIWQGRHGMEHPETAFASNNLARDLYGVGRYREALEMQELNLPAAIERLGLRHPEVLLAARTVAIALRKTGRYDEALRQSEENYLAYQGRFGRQHVNTLAAAMTYAQSMRVVGRTAQACDLAEEADRALSARLGDRHPLALTAHVNYGIMLRAAGDLRRALQVDTQTAEAFATVMGERHPYALCAATCLAVDLALHHDYGQASAMSQRVLGLSKEVRGEEHPYTLAVSCNAAFDLQAAGDRPTGQRLYESAMATLRRILGNNHPEVLDLVRGKRAECDIEPPPV
jgi:hypothetical protein